MIVALCMTMGTTERAIMRGSGSSDYSFDDFDGVQGQRNKSAVLGPCSANCCMSRAYFTLLQHA